MLLERDQPLQTLASLAHSAAAGRGAIALIEGEAGIGKTALLREFAQRLGPECRVLWGGCEALFAPRPLGPLEDIAGELGPRVVALLDDAAAPSRLFQAVFDCLREARCATVLVFEDVHWADAATLDLLKYLGRRIAPLRVLLVMSSRNDETGAEHPLVQLLGDLGGLTRIALAPLSSQAVDALARQAGRSGSHLHRVTSGNAFFVTELLASPEGAFGRIPGSVRDAIWARLARMNPAEREVLEMASVVPGAVEARLVEAVLGAASIAALDRCVERGMLVRGEPGLLMFRHELARQATLDRLAPARQRDLHARVGAALADEGVGLARTALSRRVHHAAGAEDGALVLALAPLAAAQAAALGAHQQAAAHLAAALRFVAQAPAALAAQLHEDWAYEAGLALRIDDAVIEARHLACALWREVGRIDKVGHNLRWLSRLHWYRGEPVQAERYIAEAVSELERLPPGAELAMAYSVQSQWHMLQDHPDEAIAWGERAMVLALQLGEVQTRVHALNNVGTSMLFANRPGGRERLQESLALALAHGFHEHAARVYTNLSEYAVVFRDFVLAEQVLANGIAFDTRHDLDAWTHYLVGWQARLRMEQGRLKEAEAIARDVLRLERLTLVMRLPALTVLGHVRMRQGEADGLPLLQQALAGAMATGEGQRIVPVRLALAEAAWLAGELPQCRAELAALQAIDTSGMNLWDQGQVAVWQRRAGLAVQASVAYPAPHAAELRGDAPAAAQAWLALGLPCEAALASMQVEAHPEPARAGGLAQAVQLLEESQAWAAATCARAIAQRLGLAAHLPRLRRGPYSAAREHPLGLTQRELQVARFIGEGLNNADIAQRLSRSVRTVEHHVSAVLAKLDAGTRLDLIARLRREPGLLSTAAPIDGD